MSWLKPRTPPSHIILNPEYRVGRVGRDEENMFDAEFLNFFSLHASVNVSQTFYPFLLQATFLGLDMEECWDLLKSLVRPRIVYFWCESRSIYLIPHRRLQDVYEILMFAFYLDVL